MLNNRKELVKRFLKEGFTHRTLSSFSDTQLKELSKKLLFSMCEFLSKFEYYISGI